MNRKIACITLDVEADFKDPDGRIRLFEDEALLNQYVRLIDRTGAKVTAFLVTSLLDRYGDEYERLRKLIPVEFEIHSHAHDLRNPCSRADIEAAVSAFRGFAGKDPTGYRAPVGLITHEGLDTLFDLGFRYDSSVYPSLRPGKPVHINLHLPVVPFRITRGANSIIEVPFACLPGVRLDFSLSFVKMLGWRTYELLMKRFPLPDHVAVLSHPYDHYVHLLPYEISGWEAPLLRRNAGSAFELLERMLGFLGASGYEFEFLSGLCDYLAPNPLREFSIERVLRERGTSTGGH
jgi:peptidoglycan/xylan/chitin deacetylase (PgdA/CDA1 family)